MSNSTIQLNKIVRSGLSRSCRGFLSGKKITIVFAILFAAGVNSSRAQDSWIQKADLGGAARTGAVGFSIGNKGYTGTGYGVTNRLKNFWEYDPATNVWTQKADFGGAARVSAVGFSIGSKGYLGTGRGHNTPLDDFWEYDPSANTWTQKADFGGGTREYSAGFSIGTKGYVAAGVHNGSYMNDFWEYDPSINTWTQKAGFPGAARISAAGFSIGDKGYLGTGYLGFNGLTKDFWEYDPSSNTWTQKADFGGTAREEAVGFSIGSKGYIGTGSGTNDFWEYDPSPNTWTQKADFGGAARGGAVGFSIDSKGYIGTGTDTDVLKDFWEYTPDISSCPAPTNLSATNITAFSAMLNWDAVVGAASYKVRYRVAGTNQWTVTNSNGNSINLTNLSPDTKYNWQVRTLCTGAPASDWSAKKNFHTAPLRLSDVPVQETSFQIYPNPAGDRATIQFTLAQTSRVSIKVFDVSGKEVEVLLDAELQQGENSLQLNTHHFSNGVYMVKMISDFGTVNQKLIVQ